MPPNPPRSRQHWKKLWQSKIFWIVLVVVWLALGGKLVFGNKGLYHLYQLSQERDRLLKINQTVKAENDRLAATVERLQHDQALIEEMIRRELRYIKKNEIIYHLEPKTKARPEAPRRQPAPPKRSVTTKPRS